jgi:hypothetical protein
VYLTDIKGKNEVNKSRQHTTIGLKKTTKQKLMNARAPGQCYDGFLCQLLELWDAAHDNGQISFQKTSTGEGSRKLSTLKVI